MEINKINKNYNNIEKYLKILNQFNIKNKDEFFIKQKDYLAISMALFNILNACIEIGEELIDIKKLDFPSTYKKIFLILSQNNLISKNLGKNLSNFMYQRNMIAHQYDEIDSDEIFDLFLKKDIFLEFIKETKKYFKKN